MNPLRAAMESIAFQDKGFANSLTKYFQSILDNYKNGHDAQNSEERDQIVKLTFERTGIKINLTIDGDNSFTVIPQINNGHIFEHHWFRETANNDENVLLKRMKLLKQTSYVDLKNARVGGFFSEIESPIYVGYDLLKMSKQVQLKLLLLIYMSSVTYLLLTSILVVQSLVTLLCLLL